MASGNHEQALQQLQTEVNRILEQTGRVFAAANGSSKSTPQAQMMRLRKILPDANARFHAALDELEEELQMAQLVMRHDLALYRDKSKPPKDAPLVEAPASETLEKEALPSSETLTGDEMEDVKIAGTSPNGEVKEEPTAEAAPTSTDEPPSTSPETKAEQPEEKPEAAPEPGVSVDTKTQPETQDAEQPSKEEDPQENPADSTTFSNTPDLDYLFGGPISAEPADNNATSDFNFDDANGANTAADDFDFDAFANSLAGANAGMPDGDDNIASLLPGLEDYANTAPVGDGTMNFDDIFNSSLPTDNATGGDGNNPALPRDSTFDDLLDLPDFGVGELTGENGGEGGGANDEFNFDLS